MTKLREFTSLAFAWLLAITGTLIVIGIVAAVAYNFLTHVTFDEFSTFVGRLIIGSVILFVVFVALGYSFSWLGDVLDWFGRRVRGY
jgi:hypothetical protein